MRRYPYQHMHVVPIDGSSVDGHLVRPRDFPQQLPRPLPDIAAQHRKSLLCYPHNVILAVPDRVTSGLRILHTRSVASQSPKGEGFTDPRDGTLNAAMKRLALGERWAAKRMKALRFHLIGLPGRVVSHARRLIIRLGGGAEALATLLDARQRIRALAQEPAG